MDRNRGDRCRLVGTALLLIGLVACAAPPEAPLDEEAVAERVTRGEAPAEDLRLALELVSLAPLGVSVAPPDALAAGTGTADGTWHARALAMAPAMRAARQDVLARSAARESAGVPGPIVVPAQLRDWSDVGLQRVVSVTLDLLGLLGVGPYAADRRLAEADLRAAVGRLEAAAWRAVFAVDRARLRLAAARARAERFAGFVAEVRESHHRVERLAARGRLGPGLEGRARAVLDEMEERERLLVVEVAARRRELALASGMAPGSPVLDADEPGLVERLAGADAVPAAPGPRGLVQRHPALRSGVLAYALAEARLRRLAAERWPGLSAGPRFELVPDDLLLGGMLTLAVPFPGSVEGRIAASVAQRTATRLALEDRLLELVAEIGARRTELDEALRIRTVEGPRREEASRRAWRAARARFAVEEEAIELWFDALQLRSRGVLAGIDADARAAEARLAYHEAAALPPATEERS